MTAMRLVMPRKLVLLNMMPMMFCTLPIVAYGFGRLPALQRASKHYIRLYVPLSQ
jgi:hypothetical protein